MCIRQNRRDELAFTAFANVVKEFAEKHNWKSWGFRENSNGRTCFFVECDLKELVDWL